MPILVIDIDIHKYYSTKILTLFHVASKPTYFSNFVIFKDRYLKFGDDI